MAEKWTLDDGLSLIRAIQPKSREFGYHVAMGGGVLNKGVSEKDLDVYFLPLDNGKIQPNPEGIVGWLTELWGQPELIGKYKDPADEYPQMDTKCPRCGDRYAHHDGWRCPAGGMWPREYRDRPYDPYGLYKKPAVQPVAQYFVRAEQAVVMQQPQWVVVGEDQQIENAVFNAAQAPDWVQKTPTQSTAYKYKLKFIRPGEDRIDVFIVG